MSKLKGLVAATAIGATTLFSGAAMADWTGTIGATSEYMFRGIASEAGAAVQGSLDYSHASGMYAGAWASNANPTGNAGGGNELDLYFGWAPELSNGIGLDFGLVYYAFTEDEENDIVIGGVPVSSIAFLPAAAGFDPIDDLNYFEIYAGVGVGPVSATLYYTDDYFGVDGHSTLAVNPANNAAVIDPSTDGDAIYFTIDYTMTLKDTVDLTFQIGHSSGDGVEAFVGDDYTDWSITLAKDLGNGFGASFAYIQTDLDLNGTEGTVFGPGGLLSGPSAPAGAGPTTNEYTDDPKFVLTLTKDFDI